MPTRRARLAQQFPTPSPDKLIPLPEVLQRSAGFLLGKAAQRANEYAEASMRQFGIKPRHYGVLTLIARYGGMSQFELGSVLRIDRSTMVTVVDELRQMDLVDREPDPMDRRANVVKLTQFGSEQLAKMRSAMAHGDAQLTEGLSEGEREQLLELLRKLLDIEAFRTPRLASNEPPQAAL